MELSNNRSLLLQPYDWSAHCEGWKEPNIIDCFALDEQDRAHVIHIVGYPSTVKLQLPPKCGNNVWTKARVDIVIAKVKELAKNWGTEILKAVPSSLRALYGIQEKPTIFVELYFQNIRKVGSFQKKMTALMGKPNGSGAKPGIAFGNLPRIDYPLVEAKIDLLTKFLVWRNLKPCQWIRFQVEPTPAQDKKSSTEREYNAKPLEVEPDNEPRENSHPSVFSFDLETYSDVHRRMPNSEDISHPAYLISVVYQRLGLPETRRRYIILIGDCLPLNEARIGKIDVRKFDEEIDGLIEFMNLMRELDAEIITGYNIFGYDWKYLRDRMDLWRAEWPALGRLQDAVSTMYYKPGDDGKAKKKGKKIYPVYYLSMSGRVPLELMILMLQNYKLPTYRLNVVANHILGRGKDDVSAQQMFLAYERMQRAIENYRAGRLTREEYEGELHDITAVVEYCVIDSDLPVDIIEATSTWLNAVETCNIVGIRPDQFWNQGQTARCKAMLYGEIVRSGRVFIERPGNSEYIGGFVFPPRRGIWDCVLMLDFNSLYPSIIIAYNICYTTMLMPDEIAGADLSRYHEITYDKPDGTEATCYFLKAEYGVGILPRKVNELIEERRRVRREKYTFDGCQAVYRYALQLAIYFQGRGSKPYLHDDHEKAPAEYKKLLAELQHVYETCAIDSPEAQAVALRQDEFAERENFFATAVKTAEARQLALKTIGNSVYGFLGASFSGIPLFEGAACVTKMGRVLIQQVETYVIENWGGTRVYGDTDSVMMSVGLTDPAQCYYMGKKLEDAINGIEAGAKDCDGVVHEVAIPGVFLSPLAMECEYGCRICTMTKKCYMYYPIGKDGSFKMETFVDDDGIQKRRPAIQYKGVASVRRDRSVVTQKISDKVNRMVMDLYTAEQIMEELVILAQRVIDGGYEPDDYVSTTTAAAGYSDKATCIGKGLVPRLRREGRSAQPGERIPYVIVDNGEVSKGLKAMTIDEYKEALEDGTAPPIDVTHYLEGLVNAVDKVLSAAFAERTDLEAVTYIPRTGMLVRDARSPMEILAMLHKKGKPLGALQLAVKKGITVDQAIVKMARR